MNGAALTRAAWVASGTIVPVTVRGGTHGIWTRASGNGGATLFFLHGFPTSSWDWAKTEALLDARPYRRVFFDFLGFGASGKPARHRYDLLEQADIAEAIAARAGIERALLIAHDYGVSVAQELLARDAERRLGFELRGAVLLNGGLYPDLHRPVRLQRILRSPLGPLVSRFANEPRTMKALSAVFAREPDPDELAQHWASIAQNGGARLGHRLIRYIDDRLAHQRRWIDALETTRVPLTFVWGMRDPVSGAHVMERLHARFEGRAALVELRDAGHYPQLEDPGRVASAIESALAND